MNCNVAYCKFMLCKLSVWDCLSEIENWCFSETVLKAKSRKLIPLICLSLVVNFMFGTTCEVNEASLFFVCLKHAEISLTYLCQ